MNERIQELAKQAGFRADVTVSDGQNNHIVTKTEESLEKFAELLLKDVAQFVEDKFDFCGDELIIAEQILKHFGVDQ